MVKERPRPVGRPSKNWQESVRLLPLNKDDTRSRTDRELRRRAKANPAQAGQQPQKLLG